MITPAVLEPKTETVSPGPGPAAQGARAAENSPGMPALSVDELLRAAAGYASQALQELVAQADGDETRLRGVFYNYVDFAFQLEVHFLFPNLTDAERLLLVGLGTARSALLVGLKNGPHYEKSGQQGRHEATMGEVKQRFLMLRAEVGARGFASRMTPTQVLLLEREFLSLPSGPNWPGLPGRLASNGRSG